MTASDIFVAIETDAPPPQVSQRSDHPVARLGIANQTHKLETNKFYANFFVGNQNQATWTHPYSVAWAKGSGAAQSWGLAVSHIERSQLALGPGDPAGYFFSPVGVQSLILSAAELGSNTNLTTDSLEGFSVNVNLLPNATAPAAITFPLVQGMGFVTGIYNSSTPWIQSSVTISTLSYGGKVANTNIVKYRAVLGDGHTWIIYVTPLQSGYPANTFTLTNSTLIVGQSAFTGYIQVAKIPTNVTDAESYYDQAAGAYASTATISGSVNGNTGSYSLTWTKEGIANTTLLMFALPHHIETLSGSPVVTDIQLETTTKGMATAVFANSWTLVEQNLPIDMTFAPWSPTLGSVTNVSSAAKELINAAGLTELSQDIGSQTDLNSMYYSGKALAKFAAIVYALHDIAENTTLALTGLQELEAAFSVFVNNTQIYPLYYESAWGGAVSSSTYLDGNYNDDFGNTYYNDHHFHYGYFVYTAAVIGYLDSNWLTQGTNKAWVNMLVRDYANSITDDPYFPFSRSFDWYHGHSWAKGLFESADGKDQESSSEDSMAAFGIKMWGRTIGDTAMQARGNLMQSLQARSLQNYFLYASNNTVEPADFIGNKVSGILFENKIDHTTYFGTNPEYIEGIHMIPLMPFSTLTRTTNFVTEEWDTYFSDGRVDSVAGGWRGILYANLAIIDPVTSWNFFANTSFDYSLLDGGASLTWYRTLSAALGGSPGNSTSSETGSGSGASISSSSAATTSSSAASTSKAATSTSAVTSSTKQVNSSTSKTTSSSGSASTSTKPTTTTTSTTTSSVPTTTSSETTSSSTPVTTTTAAATTTNGGSAATSTAAYASIAKRCANLSKRDVEQKLRRRFTQEPAAALYA